MNDTPRTSAATLTEPYQVRELPFEVVRADFAEQLERELAAVTADLEFRRELGALQQQEYDKVTAERDVLIEANAASARALDKIIEMRSYCIGILRDAGHDEAAPLESLVRSSIAYANRLENERDALKDKLEKINAIAMSLFVRTTSSEVTGEMAEIGRLSRADGI